MNPLWVPHRAAVDRGRRALARIQRPQRSTIAAPTTGNPEILRGLRQPDNNTCGSCTLVALKMLRTPSYAELILASDDPATTFANAALGVLKATNASRDRRGRRQLPWPHIGGTRPAAMTRLLSSDEGFGAPGLRYRTMVIDPRAAGQAFDQIRDNVVAGEPTPLYVGDHRWMQHIVLVTNAGRDRMRAYNPARGDFDTITREEFVADRIDVRPWTRPWLAILPR